MKFFSLEILVRLIRFAPCSSAISVFKFWKHKEIIILVYEENENVLTAGIVFIEHIQEFSFEV